MNAESLISDTILPLRTSDTGEEALAMMNDFYVRHLPIVNNKQLLGLISEDDILDFDAKEAVGSYSLSVTRPFVRSTDHLFEVMRLISHHHLTVIPVVDQEDNYIGLITMDDLLHYFANTLPFSDPGSIIVLEMGRQDYSLSEICRILESENAIALSTFVTSIPDSSRIQVTVKTNSQNTQTLIATFERFNYQVQASFSEANFKDTLRERFDSLMSYLNI